MSCQKCNSERILSVSGKCSDMSVVQYKDMEHIGYVPDNLNIGSGDYLEFDVCLDCGYMQGDFPIDDEQVEESLNA